MIRAISLFAVCFGVAAFLSLATVGATPLTNGAEGVGAAAPEPIVKVHGCHHFCARGPRGWHRHGPRCGRYPC